MLKFLREQNVPWDESTCALAARGGNMETLQWANRCGCPWDNRTYEAAMSGGHHEIGEWARNHGCPATDGTQWIESQDNWSNSDDWGESDPGD